MTLLYRQCIIFRLAETGVHLTQLISCSWHEDLACDSYSSEAAYFIVKIPLCEADNRSANQETGLLYRTRSFSQNTQHAAVGPILSQRNPIYLLYHFSKTAVFNWRYAYHWWYAESRQMDAKLFGLFEFERQ